MISYSVPLRLEEWSRAHQRVRNDAEDPKRHDAAQSAGLSVCSLPNYVHAVDQSRQDAGPYGASPPARPIPQAAGPPGLTARICKSLVVITPHSTSVGRPQQASANASCQTRQAAYHEGVLSDPGPSDKILKDLALDALEYKMRANSPRYSPRNYRADSLTSQAREPCTISQIIQVSLSVAPSTETIS